MAAILLGDVRDGLRGKDVPSQDAARYQSAVAPGEPIDGRSRAHVRRPGQDENQPRVHHAAARQERAECDGDVGGNRRKDVFDGGQHGDQRGQRPGGELLEKREKVRQETECPPLSRWALGPVSVATAMTAMPSPRPIQPMPSFVLAFTETCAGPVSSASESFSSMASMWGASLGFSRITVTSAWTNWNPASTTFRKALFKRSSEWAPFHCGSSGGNRRPMSPSPAAPRIASVRACATASASEWPARPWAFGISTPPRMSLRPLAKGCESYPIPTRIRRAVSWVG